MNSSGAYISGAQKTDLKINPPKLLALVVQVIGVTLVDQSPDTAIFRLVYITLGRNMARALQHCGL